MNPIACALIRAQRFLKLGAIPIDSSDQPPALLLTVAVIKIYLEDIALFVSDDKIAAVSARVPFAAAGWEAAVPRVHAFLQHLNDLVGFTAPGKMQGLRRRFRLLYLYLLSKKFFHKENV
jgi:hypothetical protein